jgi:osmoprotectant transport system permease protein
VTGSRSLARALFGSVMSLAWLFAFASRASAEPTLRIGSKRFTESYVLAEIAAVVARNSGADVEHAQGLGGTAIAYAAVESGAVDLYPEYTGTITEAIVHDASAKTLDELRARLLTKGLGITASLGFENTYALAVLSASERARGLKRVGQLGARRDLVFGVSHEFAGRDDGFVGLARRYGLTHVVPETLDHGLAYEALVRGAIDVMDVYSTDAKIKRYGLNVLEDDLRFFPSYEAVFVYRLDVPFRFPKAFQAISALAGRLGRDRMVELNAEVELEGRAPGDVAVAFVRGESRVPGANAPRPSFVRAMLEVVALDGPRHVMLVAVSLVFAILFGIPLGIAAHRWRRLGLVVLAVVGVLQTIPSLALLCFFIPLLGIGVLPTIAALFLYSLLPIVRNTFTGLLNIPSALSESALVLGLSPRRRLFRIDLPLASRAILAGVKTAAVINVGTATVAAFVGAGGFGRAISTGLNLNDTKMILEGAVPAAVLALVVQGLFELVERALVPRGLRLDARRTSR